MPVQHITTIPQTLKLVQTLRASTRLRPAVVISTRPGSTKPLIDAEQIEGEVAGIADVYVILNGKCTWEMAAHMAEGSHVFGGAGRVYPQGVAWEHDLAKSPLRFTHSGSGSTASTQRLIDDAYMAAKPSPRSSGRGTAPNPAFAALLNFVPETPDVEPEKPKPVATPKPATPQAPVPAPEPAKAAQASEPAPTLPTPPQAISPHSIAAAGMLNDLIVIEPAPAPEPATQVQPGQALQSAQLALATSRSTVTTLQQQLNNGRRRAQQELDVATRALHVEVAELDHKLADVRERHSEKLQTARKKSGNGGTGASISAYNPELFTDSEDAMRHAIYLTWVERVPAFDKNDWALPSYAIGAQFITSFESHSGVTRTKALKCVVDVLTDLARDNASRRVHILREGQGADTITQREDGAICYRANIETDTSSARRLHYWKLTDGSLELSRVVTHDDMAA